MYLGDINTLNEEMAKFSNSVYRSLGYSFQADLQLPIYNELQFLMFFRLFLTEILFCCIFLMTTLVLLLTYALLLNDVEERTYTYGMLRALGMKHVTLIQIMIFKSITFSIPGTLISLCIVFLLNIPFTKIIEDYSYLSLSYYSLPSATFISGCSIGFVMPLIAIYLPTRRALSKTLRDSLDVYHDVTSDIKVQMIRLENLGLSPSALSVAVLLITIGIVRSIGVPYSIYYGVFFVTYCFFKSVVPEI